MSALRELARWAAALELDDVPPRVRDHAIHQLLSTMAAVYAGFDSDLGVPLQRTLQCGGHDAALTRVIPTGALAPPIHAATLMSAWSMVLDFDDVMLGGHTGHSSVLVPLAYAAGRRGSELLLAQIVANEIAARINMVCALGKTRGQMATHVHLLAAAAARAKLERLDVESFAGALAFALSYPAQALFPAFLGSDAKALCAAWPIRMGCEAVDAVRNGLFATDPLDEFFATRTRVPIRDFLGGLGERWHTETNSYKLYPVCGYLCAAVDATLQILHKHHVLAEDIASIDVWSSIFTVAMDAHSKPYLGERRIATLTFSTPFVIASTILALGFTPAQLKRAWIDDARVWKLAKRVRCHHDAGLTLRALKADIPIGAALRRARRWQAAAFALAIPELRTPRIVLGLAAAAGERKPLDLRTSTKPIGARVEILLHGGRVLRAAVDIPRAFAGSAAPLRELMRQKFVLAAGPVIGAARTAEAMTGFENLAVLPAAGVARLVDNACAHTGI